MKDKATLLYEWRELRIKLQNEFTEETLQEIITWWQSIDHHVHGLNYDHVHTWPDVWEYISEEFYTRSGNGLGCFYTIYHAMKDKNPEVWLIQDLEYSDIYLVAYADGYILNRLDGELAKYEDIKDDINILKRHKSEDIIKTIKARNHAQD